MSCEERQEITVVDLYEAVCHRYRGDGRIATEKAGYYLQPRQASAFVNRQRRNLGDNFESGEVRTIEAIKIGNKFYSGDILRIISSMELDETDGEDVCVLIDEGRAINICSGPLEIRGKVRK